MVRVRKSRKKAIFIGVIAALVIVLFSVSVFWKTTTPAVSDSKSAHTLHRHLVDTDSTVTADQEVAGYSVFTSYRLGVRIRFRTFNHNIVVDPCPATWVSCPTIHNLDTVAPPSEEGNAISFLGYRLEVFDKDPVEDIEGAMTRNIFPTASAGACSVRIYPESADGTVKAVLSGTATDGCPEKYLGTARGRHFFVYPKYPNVLLFVEGPSGVPALFDHRDTWIGTIGLLE